MCVSASCGIGCESTNTNEFLCFFRCTEVAAMTPTSVMMMMMIMMGRETPQREALKGKRKKTIELHRLSNIFITSFIFC